MKSSLNLFFIAIACIVNAKYSFGLKTLPNNGETIPSNSSSELNNSETLPSSSSMTTTASVSQELKYYTTFVNGETVVYPNNIRAVTSCIPSKVYRNDVTSDCYTKSLETFCITFTNTLTFSNTYCYLTTEMLKTTLPVFTSPCKTFTERCNVKTKTISEVMTKTIPEVMTKTIPEVMTKTISDVVITNDNFNQSSKTITKNSPKVATYTVCESVLEDTKLCVYLGTSNNTSKGLSTKIPATKSPITKTTTTSTQESTIECAITTTETIEETPSMTITEVLTTPSPKSTTTTTTNPTTTTITVTVKRDKSSTTPKNESKCAGRWAQCGGPRFKGPTCCKEGLACRKINKNLSYCY